MSETLSSSPVTALSHERLLQILRGGEPPSKLLTLTELTGERDLWERWSREITGPLPWDHTLSREAEDEIDRRLATALLSDRFSPAEPATDFVRDALPTAGARTLDRDEIALYLDEMGLSSRLDIHWSSQSSRSSATKRIAVVGAGISGIAMAVRLKRLGLPFTVFESGSSVGGTWRWSIYPGCGVDVASHYYSYSFDPNPDWTRYYARQPEIHEYLRGVADRAGLAEHLRLNTQVTSLRWDEDARVWRVGVQRGGHHESETFDAVVVAVGHLTLAKMPDVLGLDSFRGDVVHTSDWREGIDGTGQDVVVVGGGASANQVAPALAEHARSVTIVQRSAHWVLGSRNHTLSVPAEERWLLRHVPAYHRWFRARTALGQTDFSRPAQLIDPAWTAPGSVSAANAAARRRLVEYLTAAVDGRRDLVEAVTPDYPPFTKRMLRDNGWYAALLKPNVRLVRGQIQRVDRHAVVDSHGERHRADLLVFATGYDVGKLVHSVEIHGRRGVTLRDAWGDDDPRAHLGVTVPDFPNLFVMYGPNTNPGTGGSIVHIAETQSSYIADVLRTMVEERIGALEVRADAVDDYYLGLDRALRPMVWANRPGENWYANRRGRITSHMPWTNADYRARTTSWRIDQFDVSPEVGS